MSIKISLPHPCRYYVYYTGEGRVVAVLTNMYIHTNTLSCTLLEKHAVQTLSTERAVDSESLLSDALYKQFDAIS